MKLVLFAAGSRGDIQPSVALAKGLQQAGYEVRLAAPANFRDFIQSYGVHFYPLRGDVQEIMSGDTGRQFMESGSRNPLRSVRTMREMIAPVVLQMAHDFSEACKDADGVLCLGVFSAFGQCVAEALGIPLILVEPTPLRPASTFPAPSWPIQRRLGSLHNKLSGRIMMQVIWYWYKPFIETFRQQLGLAPTSAARFYRSFLAAPMLSAYSNAIIPQPPEWPAHVHITGYFFLDDQAGWQPPQDLLAFLAAGDAPVYIGFGSMSGENPAELTGLVLDALARSGQRGILLTGWGGLQPASLPENVFVLNSAPHRWLFPRMAAVVHHGGAGTTAEGLRAGVPSIIVPFILDQPFWGARIQSMGLGPAPIPRKRLTADRLAYAIQTAVDDPGIRVNAQACGKTIRTENGVQNAVQVVQRYLDKPGRIP